MDSRATEDAAANPGTIVALGASAGGLDALDRFFGAVDLPVNAAFVVIQHLAPEHETMMDKLLARHTQMPVQVAGHDMAVQTGHVYVIPPNAAMTIVGGRLKLAPRSNAGISLPINAFFDSLAQDCPDKAIGIVLSGTGSDGSLGARTLSEAGAWVMAQDPEGARFDGMPANAIATGAVDHVLSPEGLAQEVTSLCHSGLRPSSKSLRSEHVLDERDLLGSNLRTLSSLVQLNLPEYKPNTLLRRLERRLIACGIPDLHAYTAFLSSRPDEVTALRHEILIPVTAFFRDPDAFECLRDQVIVPLVEDRRDNHDDPIRVWATSCATGEEAYSIAILLLEAMENAECRAPLKFFATDVDPDYVARAGAGTFAAAQVATLPETVRERWFTRGTEGRTYTVVPRLRQSIVFSRHDLMSDAPFTNMDLITCRNMLIYLRIPAQERVMSRLSYALKADGTLFLGSSETPGRFSGDYNPVDQRSKIFRIKRRMPLLAPEATMALSSGLGRTREASWAAPDPRRGRPLVHVAQEKLCEAYAPPSILVDSARCVLHVFGRTEGLLAVRSGTPSLDLNQLLDPGLVPIVSTLMHSAIRDKKPQTASTRWALGHGDPEALTVSVVPLDDAAITVSNLLISFERSAPRARSAEPPRQIDPDQLSDMSSRHAADLERELELTRSNLNATIQELGTTNEELQASNEELMAANEELQSSNEELQSVNEELHTINAEYQAKIVEMNEINADLDSLARAAHIPLLFLDSDLRITRYTSEVLALFSLRETDIGRPITELTTNLHFEGLFDQIQRSMSEQTSLQHEVQSRDGREWMVTILPYTPTGASTVRVVISFIDLSSVLGLRDLRAVLDALPESVVVLDPDGTIVEVNSAWRDFSTRNGGSLSGTGPGIDYLEACRRAAPSDQYARRVLEGLEAILAGTRASFSQLYPCPSDGREQWFLLNATGLTKGGGVVTHYNLSDWIDPARIEHERGQN
ncbi:chemotaxis protein CheB [Thetidibacter halocola]|nr:chemotaxis protein CheB [Thetidibacter halocola]